MSFSKGLYLWKWKGKGMKQERLVSKAEVTTLMAAASLANTWECTSGCVDRGVSGSEHLLNKQSPER